MEDALPALAGGGWRATARGLLESVLGIRRSRQAFLDASRHEDPAEDVLRQFGLTPDAAGVVEAIPATGGAIVVANHPFGGADALTLIALCLRARRDFTILANEMAAAAPGVGHWFLPLSILGDRAAARQNALTLRAALEHLRGGGLLAVFPAGEVSTWRRHLGQVADGPWSPHIAALARKAGVPVLPVRFFGENPPWFHVAGAIHPLVRTALLPRVILSRRGHRVVCRAGDLIEIADIQGSADATELLRRKMESVPLP
ncbi:1-acyl-sn-glycerol-3-phosphate acyltransferase [Luteolibacter sp. LG18]|uniref:1-acyl-sn-glycerol-3-phosphate acyltransferase n=1 Tax=Luteolibacter sp. LG18 TaxID=2819286 RepID=UPI0030C69182